MKKNTQFFAKNQSKIIYFIIGGGHYAGFSVRKKTSVQIVDRNLQVEEVIFDLEDRISKTYKSQARNLLYF